MITVLKRQDNGVALYKVQGRLFEEARRCNGRVLLARQLDLIVEQLRLDGKSTVIVGVLAAVAAFRGELSRTVLRKDVLQRHIKSMQLVPALEPLVTELRQMVGKSY